MLKILKGDLEAKEHSISVRVPTVKHLQIDTHHLLYILVLKVFRKDVFCEENHSASRCVKITDPHARKRFLSSNGHCFICFEKSHVASSCKQNYKCNECNGRHHFSICTFSKLKNSPQTPQIGQSQNSQGAPATPNEDSTANNFQIIEIIF